MIHFSIFSLRCLGIDSGCRRSRSFLGISNRWDIFRFVRSVVPLLVLGAFLWVPWETSFRWFPALESSFGWRFIRLARWWGWCIHPDEEWGHVRNNIIFRRKMMKSKQFDITWWPNCALNTSPNYSRGGGGGGDVVEWVFAEIRVAELDESGLFVNSAFFHCRLNRNKTEAAMAVQRALALTLGVGQCTVARGRFKSRLLLRNSGRFSRRWCRHGDFVQFAVVNRTVWQARTTR